MTTIGKLNKIVLREWRGYLLAVFLVALATWLKYLAQPKIIPADVPILYFLAVVPTAVVFGFGPSILVSILSLLAYDYFFIPPLYQFDVLHIWDAPILAVFLAVGLLFSYLASSLRLKNLVANQEINARRKSEAELVKYKGHLEEIVEQRTTDLEKSNLELKSEIVARKQAEESLQHYARDLEAANKELEAFSYSVSHDLRAPLRSLDGFSQAIIEDCSNQLDEKGKDYLNRVRQASQHMSQLIDDMLKLSRLSRSEMHIDKVNLGDMAKSIADELKAN